jgi:hypothetical protein
MQRTGTAGALAVQASRAYEFGGFVLDGELKLSQGGIGWIHLLDLLAMPRRVWTSKFVLKKFIATCLCLWAGQMQSDEGPSGPSVP